MVLKSGSSATWFATHETPMLDRLRANPKFELGIHPNFNFLLEGDDRNGRNAEEVIDRMLEIIPEAVCVRSHSMMQSSILLNLFYEKGLKYDCNHFIPYKEKINLKPYRCWNNLIKVMYSWEDDIECMFGNSFAFNHFEFKSELNVFDFHPIHLFLNTKDLSLYESTRPIHHSPNELFKVRNLEEGTQSFLEKLLGK